MHRIADTPTVPKAYRYSIAASCCAPSMTERASSISTWILFGAIAGSSGCADRLAIIERATEQAISTQLVSMNARCEAMAKACAEIGDRACPSWHACDMQRRETMTKGFAYADALSACADRARRSASVDEVKACLEPLVRTFVMEVSP